jgi:integrase
MAQRRGVDRPQALSLARRVCPSLRHRRWLAHRSARGRTSSGVPEQTDGAAARAPAGGHEGRRQPGLLPNDLRHTAAAFAVAHGANVYDGQNMLGHAKPSITLDV